MAVSNLMQSKASNSGDNESSMEKVATYLLRNSAPKSKYKLIGVWSWSFIFWYIATLVQLLQFSCGIFYKAVVNLKLLIFPNRSVLIHTVTAIPKREDICVLAILRITSLFQITQIPH